MSRRWGGYGTTGDGTLVLDRRPQAKDIPDALFLAAVNELDRANRYRAVEPRWVMCWEVHAALPQYPPKVLLAKAAILMRRGLLDGCDCGCRGDYVLTDAGRALIG